MELLEALEPGHRRHHQLHRNAIAACKLAWRCCVGLRGCLHHATDRPHHSVRQSRGRLSQSDGRGALPRRRAAPDARRYWRIPRPCFQRNKRRPLYLVESVISAHCRSRPNYGSIEQNRLPSPPAHGPQGNGERRRHDRGQCANMCGKNGGDDHSGEQQRQFKRVNRSPASIRAAITAITAPVTMATS